MHSLTHTHTLKLSALPVHLSIYILHNTRLGLQYPWSRFEPFVDLTHARIALHCIARIRLSDERRSTNSPGFVPRRLMAYGLEWRCVSLDPLLLLRLGPNRVVSFCHWRLWPKANRVGSLNDRPNATAECNEFALPHQPMQYALDHRANVYCIILEE